ncbi:hypothetical protein Dimus_005539 [Dionaea muscipula]
MIILISVVDYNHRTHSYGKAKKCCIGRLLMYFSYHQSMCPSVFKLELMLFFHLYIPSCSPRTKLRIMWLLYLDIGQVGELAGLAVGSAVCITSILALAGERVQGKFIRRCFLDQSAFDLPKVCTTKFNP